METVTITMSRDEAVRVLALLAGEDDEPTARLDDELKKDGDEKAKKRGRGRPKKGEETKQEEPPKQDVSEWAAPETTKEITIHDEISPAPEPAELDLNWMTGGAVEAEKPKAAITHAEAIEIVSKMNRDCGADTAAMAALMAKFNKLVVKYGKPGGRGLQAISDENRNAFLAELGA
jgi:hypothetical protein